MPEAELLERIVSDLDFLKTKILSIEETVEEIDYNLHHVKPEYIRNLESIKKKGLFLVQILKRNLVSGFKIQLRNQQAA